MLKPCVVGHWLLGWSCWGTVTSVIISWGPEVKRCAVFISFTIHCHCSLLAWSSHLWTPVVPLWPSLLLLYSIFPPIPAWQIAPARKRSIIVLHLILFCPLFPRLPPLSHRLFLSVTGQSLFSALYFSHHNGFTFLYMGTLSFSSSIFPL